MSVTNYITVNGMIEGETTGGVSRAYGTDALGSVVATYTGGALENTYQYKPYGGLLAKTGVAADPSFLWNGGSGYRVTTISNADYYVRARHFSCTTASWTTVDPLWPRQLPYSYLNGRIVTFIDPSGLKICNPKPTCLSETGKSVNNVITGWTDCCVDTGTVLSFTCVDDPCLANCAASHENVHVQQLAPCCSLAGKCYANANGNKLQQELCDDTYHTWRSRNDSIFECGAYKVSTLCWANNNALSCIGRQSVNAITVGSICCRTWNAQIISDYLSATTYCALAAEWTSKKNHMDMGCPFDSNGKIRSNWK